MVSVGQNNHSGQPWKVLFTIKKIVRRFYYLLPKIVALFGYALELHGDILKPSNGIFNNKNFHEKLMERCILNTIKPIRLGLENKIRDPTWIDNKR